MKLSKAEIAAVVVTVVFIALTAAASLPRGGGDVSVTVSAQKSAIPETVEPEESAAQLPVDINTATAEELCSLPGIGEALAARIIEYRGEHGGFKSADEIMKVPGIGEKTYEKLKDSIKTD